LLQGKCSGRAVATSNRGRSVAFAPRRQAPPTRALSLDGTLSFQASAASLNEVSADASAHEARCRETGPAPGAARLAAYRSGASISRSMSSAGLNFPAVSVSTLAASARRPA
jgi:hypothetical protein